MSILKSTHTGYKYYYPTEWVKNNCKMTVDDKIVVPDVVVEDDGVIIKIPNLSGLRLMTRITDRKEFPEQELPIMSRSFLAPNQTCLLKINEEPPKTFVIKEIYCNVDIGNWKSDILKCCKINGNVTSKYSSSKELNDLGIHPNWDWGK